MSDGPELTPFQRKLAEKRAQREAAARENQKVQQQKIQTESSHDADLVPDEPFEKSAEDAEMDRIVSGIDIIDAYRKWCGKMEPDIKGKSEGIKISCPIPGHADRDPSAWINLDKQTWFCGGCQVGGDAHDIAAYHFGYPVPGYKDGAAFHELRRDMARDFGYTFTVLPGNVTVITPPEDDEEPVAKVAAPEPTSEPDAEDAQVVELFEDDEDEDESYPTLDWRAIIPEDTYLDAYMRATSIDDVAEEYHFWNALIGLGFALGRDVRLSDFTPVYGNLFVCTLGRSGSGKSKARSHLGRLLAEALPHDWSDPNTKGVHAIPSPGSAEVLIHNFQKPIEDPTNPKKVAYFAPVRGLIDYNELSSLIGRANRQGNVLMPALMQFYDMEPVIATSSMTTGRKEAHAPFASALTTTQPKALRGLITKADDASGFLNRWVFAPGKPKRRFAIGGVQVDMKPVAPKLKEIQGWASSFRPDQMMEWSEEAAEEFTKFFHERIEPDRKRADMDLLIRIDLLMKKLVLLFSANMKEKVVPLKAVQDAIECYGYLISAYKIPEGQIGNSLQNEVSEAIMSLAAKSKDGVTARQVVRTYHRRKYPNDLVAKTLKTLTELGLLTAQAPKPGNVGRPTVRYKSAN